MTMVSPPAACGAPTARGEPCRRRAVSTVEVPGLGPRRLCSTHARYVRVHGRLPGPRGIVEPRWTAEEDAVVGAHASEPAGVTASLLGRTLVSVYQRRAALEREGRG